MDFTANDVGRSLNEFTGNEEALFRYFNHLKNDDNVSPTLVLVDQGVCVYNKYKSCQHMSR